MYNIYIYFCLEAHVKINPYLWAIIYGLVLTAFTVFVLLDTFVITRVYSVVDSDTSPSQIQSTDNASKTDSVQNNTSTISQSTASSVSESSYSDQNITVKLTEYREKDTSVYVADVRLTSAEYLKTAFAQNAYGRNVTQNTSVIAKANNVVLAVNGDFYGAREKGYVIKNGVLYRSTASKDQEDLVIYKDGSFEVINESKTTAEELSKRGAQQLLSFGPALVVDSKITVDEDDEVGKSMASNPRTAIGIIDELHYVLIVSDGRTKQSEGLSLYELAAFMHGLGCKTAYNLDGGGSSTIYFNGEVVNNPTTNGKTIKERSVSDIVYIGY